MTSEPSRAWYALPVLIFLGGATFFIVFLLDSLSLDEKLQQFKVPGEIQVVLTAPGEHIIFHEQQTTYQGRYYATEGAVTGLLCTVMSSDGREWPLKSPAGSTTYTVASRSGTSVLAFNVSQAGTYQIRCSYPEGESGAVAIFAVGQLHVFTIVVTAIAIMFGSMSAAVLAAVVIWYKQRQTPIGTPEFESSIHTDRAQ